MADLLGMDNISELAKWVILGVLGLVAIIVVGLIFAFYPIVVIATIAIVVGVLAKAAGFDAKYAFAIFVIVIVLGFFGTYVR